MSKLPAQLTRRKFVTGASAVVAAPLVLTGKPWAMARDNRVEGANDRINIAVIGMGKRCRRIVPNFLGNKNFNLVAVCDVDTTRREYFQQLVQKHYGNQDCHAYVDYQEILAREDVDAIVNATPDHWHTNINIHAMMAKKDVYSEKPLTLSLREGQEVIKAARKFKTVFQTGSQQRTEFGHKFVTAAEYVRSGRIGKVRSVNVGVGLAPTWCDLPEEEMEPGLDWDRWQGPAEARPYNSTLSPRGMHNHYPKWRAYRNYCGGSLADMGAHHFDIAQWGLGMDGSGPVKVVPPQDPDSGYGAELVYANGIRLIHGGPSGATFVGDNGIIAVDRGRLHSVTPQILEKPLGDNDVRLPRHKSHIDNWADCIRSREKPVCDVEIGARSAAICQLMNIAYWSGKELAWNPENWRFADDDGNKFLDYKRRSAYELPKF